MEHLIVWGLLIRCIFIVWAFYIFVCLFVGFCVWLCIKQDRFRPFPPKSSLFTYILVKQKSNSSIFSQKLLKQKTLLYTLFLYDFMGDFSPKGCMCNCVWDLSLKVLLKMLYILNNMILLIYTYNFAKLNSKHWFLNIKPKIQVSTFVQFFLFKLSEPKDSISLDIMWY